nr:hypothetical protein [Kibdelosporangium sp. MJ126-NF4]
MIHPATCPTTPVGRWNCASPPRGAHHRRTRSVSLSLMSIGRAKHFE